MKKILLLIPILILLTGCYNYRELNDLAIVSAMSINKENDKYKVTIQVVNPKKEQDTSSSNEPDFITFKSEAKSLQKAFRLIIKESPKRIYATQMQILIIDEKLAKDSLEDILDFIAREPEIRNEFYVLIGKNEDILEVLTPLDNISSQNIMESLTVSNKYLGTTNLVSFNDLISNYQNDNIEIALPSIKLAGDKKDGETEQTLENTRPEASVVLSNTGIFKDNKFLGYLTEKESLVYNFVMNNVTNTIITNNYKDNRYIVTEIIGVKSKVNAKPKNNKIELKINGKATITEVNYDIDLTKEKNIKKVQKKLNNNIEKLIKESIKDINEKYNSDIYGFKDLFYKTDPKYFKKIKAKWYNQIFNNLEFDVTSDIEIVEQGNLLGGIKHE